MKMKPLVFQGIDSKDVFEFLIDYHENLHKMGIMEMYDVEFEIFQLQAEANQWLKSFLECRNILPPLACTYFQNMFLDKYVPHTYWY